VTGYISPDGTNWTQAGSVNLGNLSYVAYAGLIVSPAIGGAGQANTAVFSNVTLPFGATAPPSTPAGLTAFGANTGANLTWSPATGAVSYNVKRGTSATGPFTTITTGVINPVFADYGLFNGSNYFYVVTADGVTYYYEVTAFSVKRAIVSGDPYTTITNVTGSSCTDTGLVNGVTYYYVVSAFNGWGESGNSEPVSATRAALGVALTGAIIGTPGSWNNQGNTITNVFDGNLATFFDAPNGSGGWVGLDFGAPKAILQIAYAPRPSFPSRKVGGIFQGANDSNFVGAVNLFTVAGTPPVGVFSQVTITNGVGYRYVRYRSPTAGYCNVAELKFFGADANAPRPPAAPTGLAASGGNAQVALSWSALPAVKRLRP